MKKLFCFLFSSRPFSRKKLRVVVVDFLFFAWETHNLVGRTGLISFLQYICLVFLAKWVARPTRARDVLICCWDWPNNRPAVVNVIFIKFFFLSFSLFTQWPKVVFFFVFYIAVLTTYYWYLFWPIVPLRRLGSYRVFNARPFFFFFFRWKNHHNLKSLDLIWSKERNKHKRSIYTLDIVGQSLIATKETAQFLYEWNNIISREYETSPKPPEQINKDRNWS